ncbi:MAG: methylenetetrahydrofolate reductase [NAD(P)H] [Actinomycetota bacterium]
MTDRTPHHPSPSPTHHANATDPERQRPHLDETAARLARRPWPAARLRTDLSISFEFFPPNDWAAEARLAQCVDQLVPLQPEFVSVTYGAGGTTQDRTHRTIERIAETADVPVAGHLTCVGATRAEVDRVVDDYLAAGVHHIVALRGDPPAGETDGTLPDGYRSAAELVAGIRRRVDDHVEISVAAYPEVHPKAASAAADLDNLKAKFDAGADRAITQFFFDTDVFARFLDSVRKAGIFAPIVPGIMPVTNFANVCRFSERCGTVVPTWMHDLFAGLDDVPEVRQLVAATVAAEQCRRLAEFGITRFHIYTMNRPELAAAVCRILGVRPDTPAEAASRLAV